MQYDDNKDNNRFIGSASIYTFVVIVLALYGFFYIYPEYTAILENSATVNAQNLKYIATEKNGLDFQELKEYLGKNPAKQTQAKVYLSDKGRFDAVITKPSTEKKDYNSWLVSQLWQKTQYEEEIQKNNAIIENILPLFASQKISDFRDDAEQPVTGIITLRSFIRFVETNLLGKYSLQSFSPIGINSMVFDDKEKNSDNIGSFVINLDISGQNSNIKAMMNTIQSSGRISIKDGKLESSKDITNTNRLYSPLNNLLITIDDVKFSSDISDDTKDNKGMIALRFYVRGIGKTELATINQNLRSRYGKLVAEFGKTVDCSKAKSNIACIDPAGIRAVNTLKALQRDMGAIKTQADELEKSTNTIEWDLNKAFQFQASLNAIEKKQKDNSDIIKKLQNPWVK